MHTWSPEKSGMTFLKIGHMASAKNFRNGNESTFRQTSMHHTNVSENKKLLPMQTYILSSPHTRFTYKTSYTPHTEARRPRKTYICMSSNYSPSRFDPRRDRGEREWCLERIVKKERYGGGK